MDGRMDRMDRAGGRRALPAFLLPAAAVLAAAAVLIGLSAAAGARSPGHGNVGHSATTSAAAAANAGSSGSSGASEYLVVGGVDGLPGIQVLGHATSEKRASALADRVARILPDAWIYAALTTGIPPRAAVVTVADHALYTTDVARVAEPATAAETCGVTYGTGDLPEVEVDASCGEDGRTLVALLAHELAHAAMLQGGLDDRLPTWVNEAVAVESGNRALCGDPGDGSCEVPSTLASEVVSAGARHRPISADFEALKSPASYEAAMAATQYWEEDVGWLALRWIAAHSPAGRLDAPGFLAAVKADGYGPAFRTLFGRDESTALDEVTAWARRAETGGGWDPAVFWQRPEVSDTPSVADLRQEQRLFSFLASQLPPRIPRPASSPASGGGQR